MIANTGRTLVTLALFTSLTLLISCENQLSSGGGDVVDPGIPEEGIRYVATAGDGGNDTTGTGSRTMPFASIDAAMDDLASEPGEREVRVAAGTYLYSFRSLDLEQGILIRGGYNPGNWDERNPDAFETVISGDQTRWTVEANGLTETPRTGLDGVTVEADLSATGRTTNYAIYVLNSELIITDTKILGGRGNNSASEALYVSGTSSGVVRTVVVDGVTITVNGSATPFTARGVNVYQANGGGSNVRITDSSIESGPATNSSIGISINDGPGSLTVERTAITVGTGTNFSEGISLGQGDGHQIRNNTIAMAGGDDSIGITTYYSDNVLIDGNRITAPAGDGTSRSIGIETGAGSNVRMWNNLVHRAAGGNRGFVAIFARSSGPVYNNTLVTSNGTGDFVGIRTDVFGPNASNPLVRNNIVAATATGTADAVGLRITDADPATETTPALFEHNLFHQMDTLITFGATDYNEASDLNDESRTTARADGTAEGNLVADPGFESGGFRLTAASPATARTGGLSIDEVDRDISGAPRTDDGSGTGYSIGAYELDD